MNYICIVNNFGLRNTYWSKGDIISNVSKKEIESFEIINYFKPIKETEIKTIENNKIVEDTEIKTKKRVNNKKLDVMEV